MTEVTGPSRTPMTDVVRTSQAVAQTPKRSAKVAALTELLRRCRPADVAVVVGFLTGEPRQGRIGVGWAAVTGVTAAPAAEPSLAVADVDRALTELEAATGPGSATARHALLSALFARATSDEQAFLRRLLVGELRQGALAGIMTDAVARAAGVGPGAVRRATMLGGDLGEAAEIALASGEDGLAGVRMQLLRPVEPMLAGSSPTVAAALAETGPASVEWKLDGARIQVHRRGEQVRVCTRNLNDITERLPAVVADVRALPEDRLVLDGEALGVDEAERPRPFQDTMSRFGRDVADPIGDLGAFFFDILHVAGTDLFDEPLSNRLVALDALLPAGQRIPRTTTSHPDEGERLLEQALAAGHEGVMVKALDSPYEAGRRGKAWRKVKPVHTLDLVVLAAEWGHGRRTGWLSNLHLGARDPDGGPFVMVGKTFKGLTDELLRWQTTQLLRRAGEQEGHVVHVRPELVVEVAVDGVQRSTRYPGGVALRFARVRRYRDDKGPLDADTIDAVRAFLAWR